LAACTFEGVGIEPLMKAWGGGNVVVDQVPWGAVETIYWVALDAQDFFNEKWAQGGNPTNKMMPGRTGKQMTKSLFGGEKAICKMARGLQGERGCGAREKRGGEKTWKNERKGQQTHHLWSTL